MSKPRYPCFQCGQDIFGAKEDKIYTKRGEKADKKDGWRIYYYESRENHVDFCIDCYRGFADILSAVEEKYKYDMDLKKAEKDALVYLEKERARLKELEENKEAAQDSVKLFKPKYIFDELGKYVIGQEKARKAIAVATYNHLKQTHLSNIDNQQRAHVLLLGPTGSGKTFIVQTLANILDVPYVVVDATKFTAAGYIGDKVEHILSRLVSAAGNSLQKAERGIIYIDEIDKIGRSGATAGVGDVQVQQALLKLLEGGMQEFVPGGGDLSRGYTKKINTSGILFICGGSFASLKDKVGAASSVGFGDNDTTQTEQLTDTDRLIEYGMIPELLGRLPVRVELDALTTNDLVRILVEPKNAVVKQYQELLYYDGVNLRFSHAALEEIAKQAISKKIGARGLRSVVDGILKDLMFTLPDTTDIEAIVVDKNLKPRLLKKVQ